MREPYKQDLLARLCDTKPHVLLLFVLLLIGLIYSNTLNSPPVLDDRATFINNPALYIDNLSFDSLKKIYTGNFGQTRFIPMLSFAVDHLIGHSSSEQFHLTNIFIHLLATIAVYLLTLGLTNTAIGQKGLFFLTSGSFSLFVAALWALHPIQTNAVTYLVQRMASLATLFYFAALAGYVWARSNKSGIARATTSAVFLIAMVCAFLSKENTATLPLAVLMIEMIFISPDLGRKMIAGIRRHQWLILTIIFLLILPLVTTKLASISSSYASHGRHFNMQERLFTELRVVVFYLSLLALPLPGRLNLDHDFPISHSLLNPPATGLAFLFLVFLVLAALRGRHQHPLAAFGILFLFLNLIIESTVIPLELVFEHRLYLPSLGFIIVMVALLDWGCRFLPVPDHNELKKIFFLGILITACALAISTSLRNHVWRDKLTLYEDIVHKSPLKPRAYTTLGVELMTVGRHEEALTALQRAISLGKGQSEEYIKAANNIVTLFVSQERFQEAADWAEKLIRDRPPEKLNFDGFPLLMANLAVSYWKLDRFSDSLEAFRIGIRIHHPRHTPLLLGGMEAMLIDASTSEDGRHQLDLNKKVESIYSKMATALLMDKDYKNARTYLAKALAISPDNEKILAIKKIIDDETAKNHLARTAINNTNKPITTAGFHFRAAIYLAGFIEKSPQQILNPLVGKLLKKAVQLEPESISAAFKLARWQLQNGEVANALKLVESHLLDRPNSPLLLELAGQCYSVQGKNVHAAAMFNKLLDLYPGHPKRTRYATFIAKYSKYNALLENK